jgi:hypothetical protein
VLGAGLTCNGKGGDEPRGNQQSLHGALPPVSFA